MDKGGAQPGVSRVEVDGRPAWRKRYGSGSRRIRLALLDLVARALGLGALRPPPRHEGEGAARVEARRLQALGDAAVPVPDVLGQADGELLLSDMGDTLASRLRGATPAQAEALFADAAEAIACVHAAGQYLGQPLPRNITIDRSGRVGFLDFEEDPGEVMDLVRAQARDWLVFCSGVAKHVPFDEARMAELIGHALSSIAPEVRAELSRSARRLGFLKTLTRPLGRRAASLGKAVGGLQRALWMAGWLMLAVGLGADFVHDGEIELVSMAVDLFD